ncbi:MAG: c-type heme family protein [Caldimicrobium sp.]
MVKSLFSKLSLTTKVSLSLLALLTVFSTILTLIFYLYLREKIINQYHEKLKLFFLQMESLERYVKDDLRPIIFETLKKHPFQGDFILEAMSTTHISKRVFSYLKKNYPDIEYERVSFDPINPENKIKSFHKFLLKLQASQPYYQGIFSWKGEEYFVMAEPIYVSKDCLKCHGKLKDAPHELVKIYSLKRDFSWKEGDLMGFTVVKVSLKGALNEAKALALSIFLISLISSLFLLLFLEGFLYSLFLKPLKKLTDHLSDLKRGLLPPNTPVDLKREDEFGLLAESFNAYMKHLEEAQKALKENLKTLETLFESITHPIALINKDCRVELANKAYKENLYKKCHQDLLLKVFMEKRPFSEEIELPEGKTYQLFLYPVFAENNEVIKAVVLLEDITERKRMEEKMILTEKLAALGQLTAGLAHEINNPLSGMLLMLRQLQKNNLSEEEKKLYFNLIEQGLLKIQKLIQDLLTFSRATEIRKEKVSINELLEEVLDLSSYLLEKHQIIVKKDFSPELPEIYVDKNKLEQVFLNLILNALHAMEESEDKILTIKTELTEGAIKISFKDTGPGVPENIKHRIFDPFFTTKPPGKGTGLGLSVSLVIIERHGGKIYLDRTDQGANFIIELPLEMEKHGNY